MKREKNKISKLEWKKETLQDIVQKYKEIQETDMSNSMNMKWTIWRDWRDAQLSSVQFSSVQFSSVAQSCPTLCVPMNEARQASLSITNFWNLLKLMPTVSAMPSSPLILCHPLVLQAPIPPSLRVFSSESTLLMRGPKYWSFSFSVSPSNENWSPLG